MAKNKIAQRQWMGWDDNYDQELSNDSTTISLPQGSVEYCMLGEGDPIVITHGTPGGYDQAKLFAKPFLDAGYKVICWSRPGYINTPLSCGKSFEEQAELLGSLLDFLWLDCACLHGVSTGAVISLLFANKYPEKVKSVIFENPVSGEILCSNKLTLTNSLDSVFFNPQDSWFLNLFQHHYPSAPDKLSFKGESYFDESLVLSLLLQVYDENKSTKIVQLLKTTGPIEKRDYGFYNDIYELTRHGFNTNNLIVPYLIISGDKDDLDIIPKTYTKQLRIISGYGHQLFMEKIYSHTRNFIVEFLSQTKNI